MFGMGPIHQFYANVFASLRHSMPSPSVNSHNVPSESRWESTGGQSGPALVTRHDVTDGWSDQISILFGRLAAGMLPSCPSKVVRQPMACACVSGDMKDDGVNIQQRRARVGSLRKTRAGCGVCLYGAMPARKTHAVRLQLGLPALRSGPCCVA